MMHLCKVTSIKTLSKSFRLGADGTLIKEPGGAMFEGEALNTDIRDLQDLARVIAGLNPKQALTFGTHKGGENPSRVTVKNKVQEKPGYIARSRDYFEFQDGQRGILLLDYDPPKGEEPLSAESFWDVITGTVPALNGREHLIISSASAHICRTDGTVLIGPRGLHCFVSVENAAEIPDIGAAIDARLWLGGLGRLEQTKDGKQVKRSLIDTSVWQPERLSFDAGAHCGEGLEQRRPGPLYQSGGMLSLADVVLSDEESVRFNALMGGLKNGQATFCEDDPTPRETPAKVEVIEALNHIPADCPYDEWVRIGMALATYEGGFDIWDEWSAKGAKYPGRDELATKWRSFGTSNRVDLGDEHPERDELATKWHQSGRITLGTLFHIAQGYGYHGMVGWGAARMRIPPQLWTALANSAVGRTLVITVGETGADAACAAGIPCIALKDAHGFRSRVAGEEGQLAFELRDSIRELRVNGIIDAVVVVYDSSGHPMTKANLPKNAADFGKGKETHAVGGGKHVLNPDVYKACRSLAAIIRETFSGLPVAATWVAPETEMVKGPRGAVSSLLKGGSRGMDDALVGGSTDEIITLISDAVKDVSAFKPDAENEGYLPLGTVNGGVAVALWSKRSENLITLQGKELTNVGLLALVAGNSYLEKHFLKIDKQGGVSIDNQRAARVLADDCSLKGRFNEADRVFGSGTWLDGDGALVVNTDGGVYLQDGTAIPRIAVDRKAIYTREGACPPPAYRQVSDAEYQTVIGKIMNGLDSWQYVSDVGGDLVLGWLVMSVFLGAMASRPSLWLVAPRGSGKTQLARFIKSCLGGYAWHTDMAKESTGAGIRQMLQRSSSPCILDEMEKDNTDGTYANSERAAAAILSLLRSGFSADSDVRKGTADQTGKSFRVMTCFCLASIADPALEPADLTRIAKIYLKPIQHNGKIGKPPAMLGKEDAAAFFWGTIQRWNRYQSIFAEVRDNWLAVAGNGEAREVDTFGVLLASSMTALGLPAGQARHMLDAAMPHLMDQVQEAREASSESALILETLLGLKIDVQRHETDDHGNERIQRETMTVSRALVAALDRDNDEAQALSDVGLKVTMNGGQQYLAIALRHVSLSKLFQSTRWRKDGSWSGGLRDTAGAVRNYPVKFDGQAKKSTLIPMGALGIEVPPAPHTNAPTGSIVAFGARPKVSPLPATQIRASTPEHRPVFGGTRMMGNPIELGDDDGFADDLSDVPF